MAESAKRSYVETSLTIACKDGLLSLWLRDRTTFDGVYRPASDISKWHRGPSTSVAVKFETTSTVVLELPCDGNVGPGLKSACSVVQASAQTKVGTQFCNRQARGNFVIRQQQA